MYHTFDSLIDAIIAARAKIEAAQKEYDTLKAQVAAWKDRTRVHLGSPGNKIEAIKALRQVTGWGLVESKKAVCDDGFCHMTEAQYNALLSEANRIGWYSIHRF